jgi:hypothetical protein
LPNKAFAAERKKPRPLKSGVLGDWVAENCGADFVKPLAPALCARTRRRKKGSGEKRGQVFA